MNQRGQLIGVALVGVLAGAGAAACGGDGTGPGPSAASITGIAGDSQSAPTGGVLPFPLSFVALNSSGQPAKDVHVTWSSIPGGAISFDPADSATNINGSSSTIATATTYVGNVTIHAKVTGVPDVVFHATVLNPCNYLHPLAVGQTVSAGLTSADCLGGSFYYDFYDLTLSGQQNVRIDMHADTNDTYLILWSGVSPFPYLAFNDDSILTRARNSQLDVILPAGDYIVGATSFNAFDQFAYQVAVKTRPASMSGCREVWVLSGVSLTDDISATDCTDSSATPHHYDVARIFVLAGNVLSISERSTAINPSLALYSVIDTLAADTTNPAYTRTFVTANDDSSATNTNAFISVTVTTASYYDVIIGTSSGGETGAYSFSITTTPAPSPPNRTPASGSHEWWRTRPGGMLQLPPRLRGGGAKPGWR